jgi:hypothetical protein
MNGAASLRHFSASVLSYLKYYPVTIVAKPVMATPARHVVTAFRRKAMAEDSSKELFEFFQKMWNPMSFPIPGMFQPTMDVEEVEKKIRELQAVENWLKMNLTFVQMTAKTLEMQKSALETIQESAKQAAPEKKSKAAKPSE